MGFSSLLIQNTVYYYLQDLLKNNADKYAMAVAFLSLNSKISDLDGKLNDAGDQIKELEPTVEIVASESLFQSLLPPDMLGQKIRRADDLNDSLTLYDEA